MINRKISLLVIGFVIAFNGCGKNTEPFSGTSSCSSTSTSTVPKTHPLPPGLAGYEAMPIPVREGLREQLRAQAGGPAEGSPMLTWEQLREMHRLGMTIGAHTVTHPNLPSAGLADAASEILGSKARLEREIGAAVTMFSYPNGGAERYYTPDLQRVVREAGFAAATTSFNGIAGPASGPYALERVQVAERLEDLVFALEVERYAFKPAPRERERQG